MTFATDQAAIVARADSVITSAQAFLANLIAVSNSVLIEGTTVLPTQYDYATVPAVNFPVTTATRPTIRSPTAQIPSAPLFAFSSVSDIALPVDDLLIPTAQFEFYEQLYSSTLLDPLKAKLLDNLLNGGYGIETADEIALFNRARDREVEAALTRIDDAGRQMASRGFPLPPGELAIHIDRAYQGMQDKVSGVSRDIALKRADLYVENRKFTIQEVRQLENILIGFHNSVQERAFNAAKASVELAIAVFNNLVARYKARLEASKITSEVQLARVQAEAERARAFVEAFRSQVAAYELTLRGLIEPARLEVELYRADIDNARTLNDGLIARNTLQQKVIEATIQQNIQISDMTIRNAHARLFGVTESLKLRTESVKFGSNAYFAQLNALMGAANTLAVQTSSA